MKYLIKDNFLIDVGFQISSKQVLKVVNETNLFLANLPESLFKSIDFKTTGAIIGAIFCDKLANNIPDAVVNPIEKGHPDLIPAKGLDAHEELLRNYPTGLEIKGTIGNITQGANLRAGIRRINQLTGITWQAHHQEVEQLMGFLWDFNTQKDNFLFPTIVAVFYTNELSSNDWGAISGTTGRNTKVCGMIKTGKKKIGNGWIILPNEQIYLEKICSYLYIDDVLEVV